MWENVAQLYRGLEELGFELGSDPSPIVAIRVPSKEQTLLAWKTLLDRGIYVNLVFPPAAPAGMSLLRCSINAAHTSEQINFILKTFAELKPMMTQEM